MNRLRIFVSSPGDVAEERALAERVIHRLQSQDMGRILLEAIFWEHEPLLATESFQQQLPRASEADIAVFILWGRLGTRLPDNITRADGSRYASGTEYEFEDAHAAWSEKGKPAILTYRKTAQLQVALENEDSLMAMLAQKKALDQFEGRWFESEDRESLIGAFHPFAKPAEFEALFELHLRTLVKRHLPDASARASGAEAAWQSGSPFRGLEIFDFDHARIFAGRTRAVGDVLDALRRQAAAGRAFVMVLGMSGGGKSSLVRAGVLPMLSQPGVIEGVGRWRRAILRPSDAAGDLVGGLARALLGEDALPELMLSQEPQEVAELLRTAPKAAVALVRQALAVASLELEKSAHSRVHPHARLALVVDQLEEVFTLEGVTAEEREAFLLAIDALARSGGVWVLATLRSDFYPRCSESETLAALKEGEGSYDLKPPTAAEIGQMIRLPTSAAGLTFEGEPATGQHLADLLRDAASASPAALPLLEFTLEELYKRRTESGMLTLEAYRSLGGLEGSLAQRAEEVFAGLAPHVQAALPQVLNAIVSLKGRGEGTVGRKRFSWDSLVTPEATALVEAFVEARLFVSELADDGTAVVEATHDALLDHWPRVGAWLEENREILRVRSRVWRGAEVWQTEGRNTDHLLPAGKPLEDARMLIERPDVDLGDLSRAFIQASLAKGRRRQALKRALVGLLALLATIAAGAAFVATRQTGIARTEALRAERRSEQAQGLISFMIGDLRQKLDPLGRLEILDSVGDKAMEYFAAVSDEELSDAELLSRSKALYQIGDVRIAQGDLASALPPLEESLALALSLVERDPADGPRLFEASQSHYWVGFVRWRQRDLAAALEQFRAYLALAERLVALDPANEDWQLELGYAHSNIGSVLQEQGDLAGALAEFAATLEVDRRLVEAEPDNAGRRLDLARSYNTIGLIQEETGDFEGALASYEAELEIKEALLAHDPANTNLQYELAINLDFIEGLEFLMGREPRGEQRHGRSQAILASLVEQDPSNSRWQRQLANTLHRKGFALRREGQASAAIDPLEESIEILQALVARDPTDAGWQLDLARAQAEFGYTLESLGNRSGALAAGRAAVALLEPQVAARPDDRDAVRALSHALTLIGSALSTQGDMLTGNKSHVRALALIEPLAQGSSDWKLLEQLARTLLALGRDGEAQAVAGRLGSFGYRAPLG